jgi:hypothetical protein
VSYYGDGHIGIELGLAGPDLTLTRGNLDARDVLRLHVAMRASSVQRSASRAPNFPRPMGLASFAAGRPVNCLPQPEKAGSIKCNLIRRRLSSFSDFD